MRSVFDDESGSESLSHLSRIRLTQMTLSWQWMHRDVTTLKLLIEIGAPLKKPASETTYFELLVLAFRVFEFQRSKVENSEEVRS